MNNRYRYVEPITRPTKRKSKLLGIPRPVVGATLGFLLFLLLISSSFLGIILGYYPFMLIFPVLLGPGLLALSALGMHSNSILFFGVFYVLPSIPFITSGFLIGSHNKVWRRIGFAILALYSLTLIVFSPLLIAIWS